MLVILDWQHQGKPPQKHRDRGASCEIDGVRVHETDLTRGYIDAAAKALRDAGHSVHILEQGWYAERHAAACALSLELERPGAYVACHINAGGGSYAATYYDQRSKGGERLAGCIASALGERLPEVTKSKARSCGPEKSGRAWGVFRGIWPGPMWLSGVCFEPAFIDCEEHWPLFTSEGLERIGQALAVGVMRWGVGPKEG